MRVPTLLASSAQYQILEPGNIVLYAAAPGRVHNYDLPSRVPKTAAAATGGVT
jgi:hypothetical protein